MTQDEYLEQLELQLNSLQDSTKLSIIQKYTHHFTDSIKKGLSVEDIISKLGPPSIVAKQYLPNNMVNTHTSDNKENATYSQMDQPLGISVLRGFFVALGLFLFNLIFVLGLYIGVWAVILGFLVSGVAFIFSGILTLFSSIINTTTIFDYFLSYPTFFNEHPALLIIFSFLIIGVGTLLMFSMIWFSKLLAGTTSKYLKWTIKLIRGDRYES